MFPSLPITIDQLGGGGGGGGDKNRASRGKQCARDRQLHEGKNAQHTDKKKQRRTEAKKMGQNGMKEPEKENWKL